MTRVSVGVQSFDDRVLRVLGRRHDAASAWRACRAVIEAGLELSVDLMCGVPGQTITSWSETLEPGPPRPARTTSRSTRSRSRTARRWQVAITAGLLAEPDPDVAAEMMVLAEATLGYHGLARYEVANYAETREYESRHNTAYWTGRPYCGRWTGRTRDARRRYRSAWSGCCPTPRRAVARVRYGNAASIEDWLVGRGDSVETLTQAEARREDVMLGMRLARGVRMHDVTEAGLDSVLESLADDGLVELVDALGDGARWKTTQRGWLLGNQVFGRVWAGE